MKQENENFVPLKVGDECDFHSTISDKTTSFRCVVKEVFGDGFLYYLKEIPQEGETECGNRDALFKDNPEHKQVFVHNYEDYGDVRSEMSITNIKRK